ncbi:MAG: DUF4397 domain-containing protein [Chitinophagales bacterium]
MKKLSITLLLSLLAIFGLQAQNANVQVIHNSPDPAAETVDVYVNGVLSIDDFSFREATVYMPIPANVSVTIDIAPDTSTTVASSIANFNIGSLIDGENYSVIVNGVIDPNDFTANPDGASTALDLYIYQPARPEAQPQTNVDILTFNGAPDAPSIEINIRELPGTQSDSIAYGNFSSGYESFQPQNVIIDLINKSTGDSIVSYSASLAIAGGAGITVFTSGFIDTAANQNAPSFALYAALPINFQDPNADLATVLPFPVYAVYDNPSDTLVYSAAQFIHNVSDPGLSSVDVHVFEDTSGNFNQLIDPVSLDFRQASVYLDIPAEIPLKIVVTSSGNGIEDSLVTLDYSGGFVENQNYSMIISGLLNPANFEANPNGQSTGLEFFVYEQAKKQAQMPTNVDVLFFHGATDAPAVDIDLREFPGTEVEDIAYGDFSPNGYTSFTPVDVTVDIINNATQDVLVTDTASLSQAGTFGITVFASGFLDIDANQNGAPFALYAALPVNTQDPNASVATALQLALYLPVSEVEVFNELSLYPNPSAEFLRVNYSLKESSAFEIRFVDAKGRLIEARDLGTVSTGNNYEEFNVSGLASGTYFMQMIIDNKGFVVKPVVVSNQ